MSTSELLARIKELEIENMTLKSKLDQYQSIFTGPQGGSAASNGGDGAASAGSSGGRMRRTNRGVGISAEPQSQSSLQDMANVKFQEFKKNDR